MSLVVVDASVAAKWFFREEFTDSAIRLRDTQYRLHAPDFLLLEMDALFAKRIRRGEMSRPEATAARSALRKIPMTYHPSGALAHAAFDMACKTGGSFYDCLYLALAKNLRATLATADRRFCRMLGQTDYSGFLLWVGDIA